MPENPIYDFLKANKLTDKDEATFLKEYSDSSKAKELYGFFQANNLTDKDFNGFYDTYLKKKETASPLGGKVGNFAGRLDVGTWGSESVDEGKPIGKALGKVSGITTPEQAKISRVNKAFGKIESFAGSREDFEEIYKQAPQEFENIAKQVAPNVNKGEIDKFYTTETARKDAYMDRVLQSYNQQKTKAQLESARRYRPVIESQFSTATIPLSNYTGKQYQLPQSEAQVSEILTDIRNEKEKLKTELTTNWNLSEVETKAKELSDIESAIKQNLTYQVGRMALERLSQNNPNVTSREIGEEVFRVLHPDEYGLYKKVKGSAPVSFTVGTQRETPVEADMLNEQMVQVGNEIKRMYGNETAIQDADIEEQTAKRKYTFGRQSQVKQKLAAILNERGIKPHKATEAQKDQAAMLLEPEDKETWFENNKTYNNVDLPSTGFAYSLKNAYYNTVKDAVSTVFGGLMPDRKRMRAAEVLEGMTASDVLGEDPQFKARLTQLKDKESTQQLSEQEKQEKEQLEQFTDLRSRKQKIFDMAGSGVGKILGLGSISAFTGGLSSARTGVGALKSLVAPSGGRGGIMAASYLMSHENNAKEALRMFPNEKDALKRFFSTEFNTAIDMAVEQIFPEEQFLSGIAKKEVSKLITNLTAKNIASTLNDNAFKQLAKNIVGRSKKLLATPLQETAEEEIALALKKTFEGIIAPDKSEGLTLKDVVETGEQAFWGSVLLGAPKGILGYTNNKVPLTALWDAASTENGYTTTKMTIERLKRDGELTEAEAQDRLDNLELGRNEYLNNPILSGDMGGLDAGQKQNYFARILNEAILKKQADAVADPNLKKQYEQQIKESEAIREKIYKGEIKVTPENEELTKKEFEKQEAEQPTIDQDRDLMDEPELTEEQKVIQKAIDSKEVANVGVFADMAKRALSDPEVAKQLIDEVKSQATGEVAGELGKAEQGVRAAWGNTIVDFAVSKKQPQSGIKQQETKQTIPDVAENPAVESKVEGKVEGKGVSDVGWGDKNLEKQTELENNVKDLEAQRKALRSEDGSVPNDKIAEFNRLGKEINKAKENATRGNSTSSILIKRFDEGADKATSDPKALSKEDKEEAADIIEQAIQGSKTSDEALNRIIRLGYIFDATAQAHLKKYLDDRFDPNAPQIGNNKSSFQEWVNGVQPKSKNTPKSIIDENSKPTAAFNGLNQNKEALYFTEDVSPNHTYGLEKSGNDYILTSFLQEHKELSKRRESMIKPIFDELNVPADKDSGKEIHIIKPAVFRLIGGKLKLVEKGVVSYDKLINEQSKPAENTALRDVESTAKALEGIVKDKVKTPNDIPNTMGTHLQNITDGSWLIRDGDTSKEWVDLVNNSIKDIERIFSVVPYSGKTRDILSGIKEKVANSNYDISKEISQLSEETKKEFYKSGEGWGVNEISEAYHKAKADGSNPELIKAVEELLSKEQTTQEVKAEQPTAPETAKSEINGETLKQLKPAVKMEFLTNKELVDSKDPLGNKQKHDDIKERFKELKKIIDCLWKT